MKRLIDLLTSLFLLLLFSPLLLLIACLIKLDSRGSVFFRQWRQGKSDVPFQIHKFRSLTHCLVPRLNTPENFDPSHTEVTRIGRLLRITKIDELPQLWNVIKGEMSLVGPRPQLTDNVFDFDPQDQIRLSVKPGITGLQQVLGGIKLPFQDRFWYDVYYVNHHSMWFDFQIVVRTLLLVWIPKEGRVVLPNQYKGLFCGIIRKS